MKKYIISLLLLFILFPKIGYTYEQEELEAANFLGNLWVIESKDSATKYNLDKNITRREMLKVMINLSWLTIKDKCEWKFTDMDSSDWWCKYAETALKNGMLSANLKFNPDSKVTKAEALKMIMQSKWIKKMDAYDDWKANYVGAAHKGWLIDTEFSNYNTKEKRGIVFKTSMNAINKAPNIASGVWESCSSYSSANWWWDTCSEWLICDGSSSDHTAWFCVEDGEIFENEYMELKLERWWKVTENNFAINIEKDNYILYINPDAHHTGMGEWWRFDGIAYGNPWADLVIEFRPAVECGHNEERETFDDTVIKNLYLNNSDLENEPDWTCNKLNDDNNTIWYMSYVTIKKFWNSYFNLVNQWEPSIDDDNRQFVITMTYKTDDINKLPKKWSIDLIGKLSEMEKMIKTLKFKE